MTENDKVKRLSVHLPQAAYLELCELAEANNRSLTEVVRAAFGLVKIALEAEMRNRSLAVTDREGARILKQIVL